jgi:hypothetical protein
MSDDWRKNFRELFFAGVDRQQHGGQSPATMFEPDEVEFLESIGCSAQELFDFVDDYVYCGDVKYDDAEAIQSVRLDFFKGHLKGQPASQPMSMDDFPAKAAEVDGIPWLPRLITKARAKLRGDLPADLMYG